MALYADTSAIGEVKQFYRTGNVLFMTDGAGGIYKTAKSTYTTPSVWQSVWLEGNSIEIEDQISSVEVTFEPLDEGQEVKLEYRKPGGEWATFFIHKVTGSTKREAKRVESTNSQMPSFREIQVRATSTGGAAPITSIVVRIEDLIDE
jgi:hypothetical protein